MHISVKDVCDCTMMGVSMGIYSVMYGYFTHEPLVESLVWGSVFGVFSVALDKIVNHSSVGNSQMLKASYCLAASSVIATWISKVCFDKSPGVAKAFPLVFSTLFAVNFLRGQHLA